MTKKYRAIKEFALASQNAGCASARGSRFVFVFLEDGGGGRYIKLATPSYFP